MGLHYQSASNFSGPYDTLFEALCALAVVFATGVIVMSIYFAIRYREGSPAPRRRPEHENMKIEAVLIGGPLVLGLAMFVWGAKLYTDERTPPSNAAELFVIAKQWMWQIQHPNGIREMDNITLPVDEPVRLTMISQDVIHALFIPAFRVQFQVLPGRYTSLWFTPTKVGHYLLLCNMYCGTNHSQMVGKVDVLSRADYERWLTRNEQSGQTPVLTLAQSGASLFKANTCGACHGASDTLRGPALAGIYQQPRRLADGKTVIADDDYLRTAIMRPADQIVAGYSNSMPSYPKLTEADALALVMYIKSLSTEQAAKRSQP